MSDTVKLFVYGTLQPKGHLHKIVEPIIEKSIGATLHNYALYKHPLGFYPEITKDPSRIVKGTLLIISTYNENFIDLMVMELEAGYALQIVNVRTEHGIVMPALCFVSAEKPKGFLIESGDWLRYAKMNSNREEQNWVD